MQQVRPAPPDNLEPEGKPVPRALRVGAVSRAHEARPAPPALRVVKGNEACLERLDRQVCVHEISTFLISICYCG